MLENIMKFLKKFTKKQALDSSSKDTAKERLHLVLLQDRANVSADFLDLMRQEIIEVIKKYIEVDESAIDVRLTNQENADGTNGAPALYANIPIINIKEEARKKEGKIAKEHAKKRAEEKAKQEKSSNKENKPAETKVENKTEKVEKSESNKTEKVKKSEKEEGKAQNSTETKKAEKTEKTTTTKNAKTATKAEAKKQTKTSNSKTTNSKKKTASKK